VGPYLQLWPGNWELSGQAPATRRRSRPAALGRTAHNYLSRPTGPGSAALNRAALRPEPPTLEASIEVKPRVPQAADEVQGCGGFGGFKRVSFGIRDRDPQVATAVNRICGSISCGGAMAWCGRRSRECELWI